MAEMVANCPRCRAKDHTFTVYADVYTGLSYEWQSHHEVIAVCKRCHAPSIFVCHLADSRHKGAFQRDNSLCLYKGTVNDLVRVEHPITIRNQAGVPCPDHVPDDIKAIFEEGTGSVSGSCYNAAGAMFRKVLDAATRPLIGIEPQSVEKGHPDYISYKEAKDLRLRLDWLFKHERLTEDLRELASCVHQDGNDAAHSTETIGEEGALDLQDFTIAILETLYTRPGRIAANIARRDRRRSS